MRVLTSPQFRPAPVTQTALDDVRKSSRIKISQAAHGLVAEDVVYSNAGIWAKAKADALTTSSVVGVVESVLDINTAIIVINGEFTFTTAKTSSSIYYLSDTTAGLLTLTPPTATTSYVVQVIITTSTGAAFVQVGEPMALAKLAITDIDKMDATTVNGDPNSKVAIGSHFLTTEPFTTITANTGTATIAAAASAQGILTLSTESNSAGTAGIYIGQTTGTLNQIGLGPITIKGRINLPALSTASEEYIFRFGLGNNVTAAPTIGVFFEYDRASNTLWRLRSGNGSVTTVNASGTGSTVVQATWTKLRIEINAAGTAAEFFVNDVSMGVATGTMPVSPGNTCGLFVSIIKSAGTTARTAQVDYAWMKLDITNPM